MSEPCGCKIAWIGGSREPCSTDEPYQAIVCCPLHAAAEKMLAILNKVEWVKTFDYYTKVHLYFCPECGREQFDTDGHDEDCELAAILAAVKGRTL